MADNDSIVDFSDSCCNIAFIYRDIGAERDIPCVYWNNREWVQLMYDPFREMWSGGHPILYGAHEAITVRFCLDSSAFTIGEIASSSPDTLRFKGGTETSTGTIYLRQVVSFCRWYDAKMKTECMAERFESGEWRMATLNKEAFAWDIEGKAYSDSEILARYTEHFPRITLLGGLPPAG